MSEQFMFVTFAIPVNPCELKYSTNKKVFFLIISSQDYIAVNMYIHWSKLVSLIYIVIQFTGSA